MKLQTLMAADPDTVEKQHRRWLRLREDPNETAMLDAEILDILDRLNRLPGVATVYSCGGHDSYSDGYRRVIKDRFYVRLIATPQGVDHVAEVYADVLNRVWSYDHDRVEVDQNREPVGNEEAVGRRGKGVGNVIRAVYNKPYIDPYCVRLTTTPQPIRTDQGVSVVVPGIILQFSATDKHRRLATHALVRQALADYLTRIGSA